MSTTVSVERPQASNAPDVVIDCQADKIFYGKFLAVRDSNVPIEKGKITGFIGPSGCGKSTVLRSLNRMNDLIRGFRLEGQVNFHGRTSTQKASIRSSCDDILEWSSSNLTPFR